VFELAIAVLIMLVGSALCSGTEAALLSVSPIKAQQVALSGGRAAKALLAIRNQINRPIASIVVLNNIFNIVGSIVIGRLATTVFGNALLGVFSALLTLLIILIGEIIPKTLGERHAVDIGLAVALPVRSLTWLMTPVVVLLERITAPLVTNRIKSAIKRASSKTTKPT
jgi:CBS domain containing-hemolysin-like protein